MNKRPSLLAALFRLFLNPGMARVRVAELLRRTQADMSFGPLYRKYAGLTMISRGTYLNNLELAQVCQGVEGCVVECGVWRGGMIGGMAEVLGPDREYHLFDSFQGLPPAADVDGPAAKAWQSNTSSATYYDNCSAPRESAEHAMKLAGARRVSFHPGWFEDTIPNFQPTEPIALLRLDGDWYSSTMTCLNGLFRHLAPGGIVIFDDYLTWDGCSRAVHDFLAREQSPARVRQWRDDVAYLVAPAPLPEKSS